MTKIVVNGDLHEVEAATVADLLERLGYGDMVVATAVNGNFVPISVRARQRLGDGDEVEVLAPMQGG